MKKWGRDDAEAAAARIVKAEVEDYTAVSTTERNSVNTGVRVTAPIEPFEQAEMMARCVLARRCVRVYLSTVVTSGTNLSR